MRLARWANNKAYTPPEAPARYTVGSTTEVPNEPAITPAT